MANEELPEAVRGLAIDAGSVTTPQAKGANLLQDSAKKWKHDAHVNRLVKIIAGTGAGQQFRIKSNSEEILLIDGTWEQPLDATSIYLIVGTDIAQVLRDVFGQGSDIGPGNPLEVHDPKVGSLISFEGTTTSDGAGDGSTLICSDLTTKPEFDGNLVIITSGPFAGQARDIAGSTTGGTVSPHLNFGGQITSGTDFVIAAIRTVPAEVAALSAKIGTSTDPAGTTTVFARLRQIVDSYLADATFGLSALKSLIDAIEGKLDDGTHGLAALKALIDAIEAKLDDGVHGLAALKALIDAIEVKLDHPVHGLANMKAEVEAIEAKLDHAAYGLAAIKSEIQAIETRLDDPTNGLASIKTEVQAIEAKLDSPTYGLQSLENKLDKLAGQTPVTGSTIANWQSGIATSGSVGGDLVTIGANDTKYKLHSLIVDIVNCQAGGKITIRMYMQVNGLERKVYEEDFNKGTDPDGVWVVNGSVGIHEALRVECESNRAADNGVAIGYDYMLEAM